MNSAIASILAGVISEPWELEPITGGQSGGKIFRVRTAGGPAVVVKLLRAEDVPQHLREDYPAIDEAEYRYYTELMPVLDLPGPEILRAGKTPDGASYLVMEDLTLAHTIAPEGHVWQEQELCAIMQAYGLMHGRSWRYFQRQKPPEWLQVDPRTTYSPDRVLASLHELAGHPLTAEVVGPAVASVDLDRLAHQAAEILAAEPPVLLYNDFYPTNVAIPNDGGPAKLFDWQLVGTGPMQVDIINIGLLGRGDSFARVHRGGLLNLYLDTFAGETGWRPDTQAFQVSCRWAALLAWGVFLPRMAEGVRRAGAAGRPLSPWLADAVRTCMAEWARSSDFG